MKRTKRKDGSILIQVAESVRCGTKIRQNILATIGRALTLDEFKVFDAQARQRIIDLLNAKDPVFPELVQSFYGSPPDQKEEINLLKTKEISRVNVGMTEVMGQAYSQLDFEEIITGTRKDVEWNEILKKMVISRIFDPVSKRKSAEHVMENLGYDEIAVDKIYRMMDRLIKSEDAIKGQIFNSAMSLLNFEVDVLFFDVTTLYFESFDEDELRQFGFSKDCKFKETQVVLALVTNQEGIPLTYELFPGKKSEGGTLIEIIKKLKATYKIKNVVLIADRAMFVEANLVTLEAEGVNYIVAAKLKGLLREDHAKFLEPNYCNLGGFVKDLDRGGRRLIVSYSVDRAKRDYKQRMRLVERLLKKAKEGKIPVKTLITNHGTKKYIQMKSEQATLNHEKISQDSIWDGIHGVITNFKRNEKSATEILEKYKGLWKIEEVFRINKTDLKMRPIFHRKSKRIRAHILICFIAYTLSQFVRIRLEHKGIKMSLDVLRRTLAKREKSILKDRSTQRNYEIPSAFTEDQKAIYRAMELPISKTIRVL